MHWYVYCPIFIKPLMDKKIIFILILCILSNVLSAQILYYSVHNIDTEQSAIGRFDLANCTDTILFTYDEILFQDIAIDKTGAIYVCTQDSLYTISLIDGDISPLAGLLGDDYVGLTCGNNDILYACTNFGDTISSYNIIEDEVKILGQHSFSDYSWFGLTFFRCKLLASGAQTFFDQTIFDVNLHNTQESTIIGPTVTNEVIFGGLSMATTFDSCGNEHIFVIELEWASMVIYEYFLELNDYISVCEYFIDTAFKLYGLASPTEALQPRPTTDLDTNDSTTPSGSLDYHASPGCTTPVPIADLDATIDICHGVDSVRVWLIDGITDGLAETLITTPTTGITIQGNNSHHLLLVNDSTTTNDDFAALLSGTLYSNNTPTPTSGLRQVAVVGYCGYFPGDTAYAYITLEALPQAGGNGQLFLCPDDDPITLTDYLSGNPDPNGEWQPGTAGGSGIFNPTLDGEGSYYYIVGEPGCPQDTAEVMVDLLETPFFELSGSHWLCDGESALLESPITALQYQWQDGSADPTMVVTAPGWYWLEVTNADGCTWRDSVEIFGASAFQQTEMAAICTGENYLFEGALLENDTSLCMTYTTWQGCDSVRCLELVVTPVLLSETEATLCQGDSLYFAGTIVSESGYYVDSLLSQLGCDSVSALLLEVVPRPMLDTDTIWLLPESGQLTLDGGSGFALYHWSTGDTGHTLPVVDPGQYGLTVADENGCTTTTTLVVNRRADYYIPNAFSPNGDGINDYFTMYPGRSVHRVSHLRIYDRWGEEVYGASPLLLDLESRGWDGRFEGKPCPNGVYLYWLEVLYEDGRQEQVTGDVVLLR